jgi:hypothetical protein
MSNMPAELISMETISEVKALLNVPVVNPGETTKLSTILDQYPTVLNHLSLEEVSKLSILGIDLSRYMTAVHMNNIKVFVIKFASDSMMRVSKLIDLLNRIEERYYNNILENKYIHPKVAADMIDKIQESVTASVNLMMKLTDNETLMNLFIVNMNGLNETIIENKKKGYTDTTLILPPASRKKVSTMMESLIAALNATSIDNPVVVDAEFTDRPEYTEPTTEEDDRDI